MRLTLRNRLPLTPALSPRAGRGGRGRLFCLSVLNFGVLGTPPCAGAGEPEDDSWGWAAVVRASFLSARGERGRSNLSQIRGKLAYWGHSNLLVWAYVRV